MPFRDLIGQPHARRLLQGALRSGRISHAYLFVGPAGVGRQTAARAFAQALLCTAGGGDDACGTCPACHKVAVGTHPDLRVITPGRAESGGERRAVAIDQVRDLKHEAAYPPYEAKWKVFIIADTEQMRAEAANSLLKVLEEPPSRSVIILLSESTEALVPTLVSRSQLVRFSFVPAAAVAEALVSRAGVPPARARYLAAIAGGRVGAALDAAGAGDEPFTRRAEVLAVLRDVERGDVISALDAAEAVARQRDEVERWLDIAQWWFRDLVVWRAAGDPDLLTNRDCEGDVAEWAARRRAEDLRRVVDAIEGAKAALRHNGNPRLILEDLFVRMGAAPAAPAPRPGIPSPTTGD
jgi:DNA polymerase-3 subunit delta'